MEDDHKIDKNIKEKIEDDKISGKNAEDNQKSLKMKFTMKIHNVFSALKLDNEIFDNKEEEENKLFLKYGVNLSKKDDQGRNIIHKYSLLQKKDILKGLLEKITNSFIINEEDNYGNTPLLLACKRNYNFLNSFEYTRKLILEMLIKKGAKINVFAHKNLWTPVHWLCVNCDKESLELLLQNKAIYFTPDYKGFFPIDLAGQKV